MKRTLCNGWFCLNGMRFARGIGLVFLSVLMAGCPASKEAPEAGRDAGSEGKIIIKGSNTIGEELAPRLIVEYQKDHPTAQFTLDTKGTGYGMGALMGAQCDIAGASRLPSKEELELAQLRGVVLNDYIIGAYSVVVVVNAKNPLANLTRNQVEDIFTGAVQNWKDVGGTDGPIHLYVRDPISGTYLGFRELAMDNKPYAGTPNLFTNYEAIVKAVAQDPNGIGYSSTASAGNDGVRVVSVSGVQPSVTSVNKGQYPYARVLHLYTDKDKETPATHDFIQFVRSAHGQQILSQMGFVPQP
ncbi:MAG TPA: phosphate ABC transporter substrate-binding protein [Verrucomicrobiae bacterium]|nr:phosphate ABC transporter substrate-binding protein [Verrucomicrobiae bacterium]